MKPGEIIDYRITAEVVGEYDVIVCGGGTAGCVAAIAAARGGAKTLLLEASPFLGGMLTEGNAGLTNYVYNGETADIQTEITERLRRDPKSAQIVGGIALEFAEKLIARGAALGTAGTASSYVYTDSQEFKILLFEMMRDEGVEVLLHSPICDVIANDGRIEGVITSTKLGRRVYLAKQFIDATGDGDVAALAGVPFVLGVGKDDSVYRDGFLELGDQQEIGAMFRIGGVDFDRYVEYVSTRPDEYRPTRAGLVSLDEFVKAHNSGEMINGIGKFGKDTVTKMGSGWFQIYNYPQKGVMVGCISLLKANAERAMGRKASNGLEVKDVTRAEYETLIVAKDMVECLKKSVPGFESAFLIDTPKAGIRESRHIIGEYRVNIVDILNRVEFPDAIGKGSHPIDVGPLPTEVKEFVKPREWAFDLPYRCMVPKNIKNLLVAGKCVSATREAYGCIRPTAQCMVLGEAAGVASAIICETGCASTMDIDVSLLRERLKKAGAIV